MVDDGVSGERWELAFTLLDKLVIDRIGLEYALGISIHPS